MKFMQIRHGTCIIEIIITNGEHGTGKVREEMGNSYGFVIKGNDGETIIF